MACRVGHLAGHGSAVGLEGSSPLPLPLRVLVPARPAVAPAPAPPALFRARGHHSPRCPPTVTCRDLLLPPREVSALAPPRTRDTLPLILGTQGPMSSSSRVRDRPRGLRKEPGWPGAGPQSGPAQGRVPAQPVVGREVQRPCGGAGSPWACRESRSPEEQVPVEETAQAGDTGGHRGPGAGPHSASRVLCACQRALTEPGCGTGPQVQPQHLGRTDSQVSARELVQQGTHPQGGPVAIRRGCLAGRFLSEIPASLSLTRDTGPSARLPGFKSWWDHFLLCDGSTQLTCVGLSFWVRRGSR